MASFYAGFPVRTVNRQCSPGLQAVADVVAASNGLCDSLSDVSAANVEIKMTHLGAL